MLTTEIKTHLEMAQKCHNAILHSEFLQSKAHNNEEYDKQVALQICFQSKMAQHLNAAAKKLEQSRSDDYTNARADIRLASLDVEITNFIPDFKEEYEV